MHFLLYPTIGLGGCFLIGYLASLIIPGRRRDLEGLTIFTPVRKQRTAEGKVDPAGD